MASPPSASKVTQIYALGSNGSGQLGIGHQEDVSVPKPVLLPTSSLASLSPSSVLVRAGGNHTLIQSPNVLLFAGDHDSGSSGWTTSLPELKDCFLPVKIGDKKSESESKETWAFCAATWDATVAVKTTGDSTEVLSLGTGNKGELGLGEFIFRTVRAEKVAGIPITHDTQIVDIAACLGHVVVVLSNGDVYGWGNGRKGQLGEPASVVYEPRKIEGIDFKVARAVCGKDFTFLLSDPEEGKHAILGADKFGIKSNAPAVLPKWKDVGASWGSLFILTDEGKLVSWGRDDHGQLAPPGLPPLAKIAVGSEHVLALTAEGNVLAWGWGEHGNCGPNTDNGGNVKGRWNVIASNKYLPPNSKVVAIGAGCATSFVFVGED